MENEKKIILAVAYDEEKDVYIVDIPQGSSVAETAFGMSIVIKCLIRDGIIENSTDVTDLITKYLNDPQYQEVKNEQ
jgi:hypothetical protein